MKMKIELTDDMVDKIVVEELKLQYDLCAPDTTWCEEDRKYNTKMRKHLKAVLKHNMCSDEYREYFE